MKVIKSFVLALVLFNSSMVFSAPHAYVSGKLTYFTQWSTGLLVQIDGDNLANPNNCNVGGFYTVSATSEEYKFMKSVLLAAKFNNSRVTLGISGNVCSNTSRPQIIAVRVLD